MAWYDQNFQCLVDASMAVGIKCQGTDLYHCATCTGEMGARVTGKGLGKGVGWGVGAGLGDGVGLGVGAGVGNGLGESVVGA